MRGQFRSRGDRPGGKLGYPSEQLFEEVAYIAFHFHWPYEQIMMLEHGDRQRRVEEIAKINRRLNEEMESH